MWRELTQNILSRPAQQLSVRYEGSAGRPIVTGRLLTLGGVPHGVGRFIAEGDEALVYELLNLRDGERERVVKICRHAPSTERYAIWAVPFRVERNPMSMLADVELNTAQLIQVSGAYIKVQRYYKGEGTPDWGSRRTVLALVHETARLPLQQALARIDAVIANYGRHGVLVEIKGRLHTQAKQWEDARRFFEEAVESLRDEGTSLRLNAAMFLAAVYHQIYETQSGDIGTSVALNLDGFQLKQKIFATLEEAARDDNLSDRAMYMVLEALAEEPMFVPGLLYLAECHLDSFEPAYSRALLDRVEQIDPGNEKAAELRSLLGGFGDGEHSTIRMDEAGSPPERAEMPDSVAAQIAAHAALYHPETGLPKLTQGRRVAFEVAISEAKYAEALAVADEWIAIDPSSLDAQVAKANVLLQLERYSDAQAIAERVAEIAPQRTDALLVLAQIYIQRKEYELALRNALLAVHDSQHGRAAADCASRCYRALGDRANAIEFARLAFAEDYSQEWYVIGYVHVLRARHEGGTEEEQELADRIITRAAELDPDSAPIHFALAQSLARRGLLREAADALRRVLKTDPEHAVAKKLLDAIQQESMGPAEDSSAQFEPGGGNG
jgi:tetratricopeptide (TPR) repeat protein